MQLSNGVLTEGMKQAPGMIICGALVWMFLGHMEKASVAQQEQIKQFQQQMGEVTQTQDSTLKANGEAIMEMAKVLDRCERTLSKFPDGKAMGGDRKPSERLATIVEPFSD